VIFITNLCVINGLFCTLKVNKIVTNLLSVKCGYVMLLKIESYRHDYKIDIISSNQLK
jgi:hypothetical protein